MSNLLIIAGIVIALPVAALATVTVLYIAGSFHIQEGKRRGVVPDADEERPQLGRGHKSAVSGR